MTEAVKITKNNKKEEKRNDKKRVAWGLIWQRGPGFFWQNLLSVFKDGYWNVTRHTVKLAAGYAWNRLLYSRVYVVQTFHTPGVVTPPPPSAQHLHLHLHLHLPPPPYQHPLPLLSFMIFFLDFHVPTSPNPQLVHQMSKMQQGCWSLDG